MIIIMAGFFSMDGPVAKYGGILFDMLTLSMVWAFFSGIVPLMILLMTGLLAAVPPVLGYLILFLLVLQWGPASCAVFYVFGKKQRGTDTYTMRDFWHGYISNYVPSILFSLVITIILAFIIYNMWVISKNLALFGIIGYIIYPLEILLGVLALFAGIYGVGLIARFEMKQKDYFKYSFVMSIKHLLTTVLLAVLLAGAIYLCVFVNIMFILFVPGIYAYLSAMFLEKVFRNYMPDEDNALEEEDLEGFDLDEERQAIINRYLGQTSHDQSSEYRYVKINEEGKEELQEDHYSIVRVSDDAEKDDSGPSEP